MVLLGVVVAIVRVSGTVEIAGSQLTAVITGTVVKEIVKILATSGLGARKRTKSMEQTDRDRKATQNGQPDHM